MLRITASQVHADLTGVHPVAGNVEPKPDGGFGPGTVVKFSIPTYLLGSIRNDEGVEVPADGEQAWTGKHHETPLSFTVAARPLRAMCQNLLGQLDALEDDALEEARERPAEATRIIVRDRVKIIAGDWNRGSKGVVTQIKLEHGRIFASVDTGGSNEWYDATVLEAG